MNENISGLSRALTKGGSVIMSNGATAVALAAYPANYTGSVRLLLDGQEVADEADLSFFRIPKMMRKRWGSPAALSSAKATAAKPEVEATEWKINARVIYYSRRRSAP